MLWVKFSACETGLKGLISWGIAFWGLTMISSSKKAAKIWTSFLFYLKFFTHVDLLVVIEWVPNKLDIIEWHRISSNPLNFKGLESRNINLWNYNSIVKFFEAWNWFNIRGDSSIPQEHFQFHTHKKEKDIVRNLFILPQFGFKAWI